MIDPDEIIKNLTFDICYCCGWIGLSEDVTDNQCPQCGSEDMDDLDADIYNDDD